MFTAVAQKDLADAEKYFDEHLEQNDYYSAGEIRPGQWIGAGADRLGLKQNVTREQFHALCENRNPLNDERLTLRQKKDDKRRVFYDFTCSAPKSVSVLAVTLDDERLVVAHEESACIAFRELETFAATRVRKQGNQRDRTTGNLVAAAFTHTSSRALDPLLHTHFTVFNATFDDAEKRWKALQAGGMYGRLARRQAMLREQFGYGAIRRPPLSQFGDDILSREQVLELLRTERCKFRDRLTDCGWVKRGHRPEWVGYKPGN